MKFSAPLDATFAALADPTRRAILSRLASGEATVLELAQPFDLSQPAISKHLKVLEAAGLVSRGRDAQRRPARLEVQALAEARAWTEALQATRERRSAAVEALLEEGQPPGARPASAPPEPASPAGLSRPWRRL